MAANIPALSIQDTPTIQQALEEFRRKMCSSNVKFLHDRAEEIQKMDLPEQRRLRIFSRIFDGHVQDGRKIRSMPSLQAALDSLGLEWPVEAKIDGFIPPVLQNAKQVREYVDRLTRMVNEKYLEGEIPRHEIPRLEIPRPVELETFLQYAGGVDDPDLHGDSLCEWIPSPEWVPNDSVDQIEAFETFLKSSIVVPKETSALNTNLYWLDIKAGIFTGDRMRFDEEWHSHYIYCCPKECSEPDFIKTKDWRWRVHFSTTLCDDRFLQDFVFDTIPDFLQWYGTWAQRLSLESVYWRYYPRGEDEPDYWKD